MKGTVKVVKVSNDKKARAIIQGRVHTMHC